MGTSIDSDLDHLHQQGYVVILGYSIHPPFMGYVDGMHPRRLIEPSHGARPDGPGK